MCGAGGIALGIEVGCFDFDVLAVEATLGPGARGALLRRETERIGVGARDVPLVGDALGTFELRRELVQLEVALRNRNAEAERLGRVRSDRNTAHRLDATGHRHVDDARRHE